MRGHVQIPRRVGRRKDGEIMSCAIHAAARVAFRSSGKNGGCRSENALEGSKVAVKMDALLMFLSARHRVRFADGARVPSMVRQMLCRIAVRNRAVISSELKSRGISS